MKKITILSMLITFILISTSTLFAQSRFDEIEQANGVEESRYERLALVIGAGKTFSAKLKDYSYPAEDAKYVKKVLEEQGIFDIIYMADDSKPELRPSRQNIISILDDVEDFAAKDVIKTFVFYFSGKSGVYKNSDYLITYEIDPSTQDTTASTALFVKEVMYRISRIKDHAKTMVVLDTGNLNHTFDDTYGMKDKTIIGSDKTNMRVLYSKNDGGGNDAEMRGMITPFFTKAIAGYANRNQYGRKDNLVTFDEAGKFITEAVDKWSIKRGYHQKANMAYYNNDDITITIARDYPQEGGNLEYQPQPRISKITSTATVIEYETTHQSIGELAISTSPDFDLNTTEILVIDDITADGLNHQIEIPHDMIDLREEYYMKVYITDLETVYLESDMIEVGKNELYEMLYRNFDDDYKRLFDMINGDLLNKKYRLAVEHTLDLYYMIINYRDVFEEELLAEFESVIDIEEGDFKQIVEDIIMGNLKDADELLDNDKLEEAIDEYNETLKKVDDNDLENFALKELVERKINRAKMSIKAEQIITEADKLAEDGKYERAKTLYREALAILREVSPEALYMINQLERKIDTLPDLSYVYVGLTGGAYFNLTQIEGVLPIILADLNIRYNRHIGFGVGIDLMNMDSFQNPYYSVPIDGYGVYYLNLDLFGKFSLFNSYGYSRINHELLVRASILLDFSPKIAALPFGIGGAISPEYTIRFNELFGLSIHLRFWSIYRFEPAYFFSINFAGGLGVVFNF
jgi:hypothetical protein